MNMRTLRVAAAATILLTGAWLAPAPGQEEEESGVYFETLDVRVVNVDVYVTDKQGNPITGLTVDDFELLEDKRPVKITNFYAVEGGRPVTPVAPRPDIEEVPAPPSLRPEAPQLPENQRLHLVVYIDNFNIRPFNRNRVFRRLRTFINQNVGPGDRVMLVSYDRSLKIRQPFTSDAGLINSGLLDMEDHTGYGVHADSERRDLLRYIEEAEDVDMVLMQARNYAGSLFNDTSFTITALQDFVHTLAGLPGRKAIIYVSDGVPMRPGEDIFYLISQSYGQTSVLTEVNNFDTTRRFREVAHNASSNRVVFYTIDAAGLRPFSGVSVEQATAPTPGLSTFVDTVAIQNLQEPLRFLAEETGGRAILNTNDVGPDLVKIAHDFETYYSLGYSPPRGGDGRLHDIRVNLKNMEKGWRIRHRQTYRDKPVAARMADTTKAVLIHGYDQNPLGLRLDFGNAQSRDDGYYLQEIVVRIPLGNLVLIQQADHYRAQTKLFLSALDHEGRESDVQEIPLPIEIPAAEYERALEHDFHYQVSLLMRSGLHQVAIGVRDELGAAVSFVRRPVNVGAG